MNRNLPLVVWEGPSLKPNAIPDEVPATSEEQERKDAAERTSKKGNECEENRASLKQSHVQLTMEQGVVSTTTGF